MAGHEANVLRERAPAPMQGMAEVAGVLPSGRALLFCFSYPPLDGGISRLCAELVAGLQRKGVAMEVLSQQRDATGSEIPKAPERRVTMHRPRRELQAFRSLLRVDRSTAVICGIWYPEGLLASLAGLRPLVVLAHGLELNPTRGRWRRRAWRWMMRRVLRNATLIVANSRYTAKLVDRFAPGARVTAVPLGVDHRRFCPGDRAAARRCLAIPEDKHVILTVARVVAHKGHRLVFRALAAMSDCRRADFLYLVAGRGRDMPALQQEAASLGLDRVVRWLGYVPEADLPDLYRSADLFALCTREERDEPDVEGFGLAFLEAQACGIPVVGTRTGGIADAVQDGRGGWLIGQDDVGGLEKILASVAVDPEGIRDMGRVARQRIESEATWDHYIDRFIAALAMHGVALCKR
jgi:phosphatidyl-myo-inositol dimannoside synthase